VEALVRDVLIGSAATLVGVVFCFAGHVALRVVIPLWGAVSGFFIGAGIVASLTDDPYLRTLLGWLVGVAVGIAFGALAYAFYEVSVTVAMSLIGFTLGTGAMVAIGVGWSWAIVSVGIAVGLALAIAAIAADMPMLLLVWLSALAGAVTVVGGLMLVFGAIDIDDVGSSTTDRLHDSWGWYLVYLALVVGGLTVQLHDLDRARRTVADSWRASAASPPTPRAAPSA
jgi:hypothetical protein